MNKQKSASGLDQNLAAALSYVGVWITGLIFFLLEKDNQYVRFHSLQSLITFGVLSLITFIPFIGWVLSPLIWIIGFILWLVCIAKAYKGEEFMVPFVGQYVKKTITEK